MITCHGVAMGNYYQSNQSQHQKNERIHTIQRLHSIVQLMLNGGRAKYIYTICGSVPLIETWQTHD